jgi:hypothetical protein
LSLDVPREIKALNQKMKKLESWKRAERRQIRDVSSYPTPPAASFLLVIFWSPI